MVSDRRRPRDVGPVPGHGDRLPLVGQHPGLPRPRQFRGSDFPHRPLAARCPSTSLDSGWASSAPVPRASSRSRSSPGRPASLLSSSAPPPIRCRRTTTPSTRRSSGRSRRTTRASASATARCPSPSDRASRSTRPSALSTEPEERARVYEDRWQHGGLPVLGGIRRPALRRSGQRHGGRIRADQDPPDREGPRRGRPPVAHHGHRLQAPVRRHGLLRDVQPGQRRTGRRERVPDRGDHAEGSCGPEAGSTSSTASSSPPGSTP